MIAWGSVNQARNGWTATPGSQTAAAAVQNRRGVRRRLDRRAVGEQPAGAVHVPGGGEHQQGAEHGRAVVAGRATRAGRRTPRRSGTTSPGCPGPGRPRG